MDEIQSSESQIQRVASIQKLLGRVPTWLLEAPQAERPTPEVKPKKAVKVSRTKYRTYYFIVG